MLRRMNKSDILQIVLVRAGRTDLEEQGRIQGTLNVPLSATGAEQVARTAGELAELRFEAVYSSPCLSCCQTAQALAQSHQLKVKTLEGLQNVDLGLWHGKLLEEVKQQQPRVYRQWQSHPETVCPPQGEAFTAAQQRLSETVQRLWRKHRGETIAMVLPEPMATLACQVFLGQLDERRVIEADHGGWITIEVSSEALASAVAAGGAD